MSAHIRKHTQLTVISDTALFRKDGKTFGFGPVVRELEKVAPIFKKIVWVGFNRPDEVDNPAFDMIVCTKIEAVLLARAGGNRLIDKLLVILRLPGMAAVIFKHVSKADVIHTRAPSVPAVLAVLLSFIYQKRIWWNKYAGSWNQNDSPLSYRLQRYLFRVARHTNVTINGHWPDQPSHCISFENPCLTEHQIREGKAIQKRKHFRGPFNLVFVGNLVEKKGISRVVEALRQSNRDLVNRLDVIGDGVLRDKFSQQTSFMGDKAVLHGCLDNHGVHAFLANAHFILLPSDSEGFPKVIAEAACYGCIPVVSDAGCVGQYVKSDSNGFVWNLEGRESYSNVFGEALATSAEELVKKSGAICDLAELFTFDNFLAKLEKEVLK